MSKQQLREFLIGFSVTCLATEFARLLISGRQVNVMIVGPGEDEIEGDDHGSEKS